MIMAAIFAVMPVVAQVGVAGGAGSLNRNDNEEIMNQYFKGIIKNDTPTEVKGTPYLESNFKPAKLIFPENKPLDAAVRYDVVKEEMQVKFEEDSYRVLHTGVVVEMGGKPFKMMTYKGENKTFDLLGYFEILTPQPDSKELVLLRKYKKDVRRGKAAAAMQKATPPRYVDKDYFYLNFKDSKPVMVEKRTKNFIKLFPEAHQADIEQFIKDNKLKPKNQSDLEAIVSYYNGKY